MTKNLMLFTPGPVMTSSDLKKALGHPDMPHRRPSFEEVFIRVQKNLLYLLRANDEYRVAIISGSGTAANETALSSIILESDEVLLLKNGMFGDRLEEILSCYHYKIHKIDCEWGTPFDLSVIDETLQRNPKIKWVCVVYHETSTGMINPARKIGEIVTKYNRHLFVDCISAVGGEDIDVVRDHIDICTGCGNKAIASTTGISFVCAKRSVIPKLEVEVPRRNIYLNLQNHLNWSEKYHQTPNTPAVTMLVALDTALKELLDEGLDNRILRHQECSRIIRDGLKRLGLQLLLSDEVSSNTVTSVFLPKEVKVPEFIDELERRGYIVYPGKGPLLKMNLVQIATMGWIFPEDCRNLLQTVEETIRFLGN
jgi:2-aminoethylphosphonate-pyruvate transaminase